MECNFSSAENKIKRESYIDALKGIAIILVITGHCNLSSIVTIPIYWFHMSLFFFISGYLDSNQNIGFKEYLIKKLKRLIYPYIIFGILIILFNTIKDYLLGNFELNKLIKRIIALIYGNKIWENNYDYIGTLWFLAALFCVSIISYCLFQISNKKKRLVISFIVFFVGIVVVYVEKIINVRLPWCLDVALVAIPFFASGHILREKIKENALYIKIYSGKFVIICFAAAVIFSIANLAYMFFMKYKSLKTDMLALNLGIICLFVIGALSWSVSIFIISKIINIGRLSLLCLIGKCSLIIMITHLYIKEILELIFAKFSFWGIKYIIFVLTVLFSVSVSVVIYRYFPWLYTFNWGLKQKRGGKSEKN